MSVPIWTTLNILQERVIKELSGGEIPNDTPYDPDFVIMTVRDAMNEDLKLELLGKRTGQTDDKSAVSQYIATYPSIELQFDTVTKRVYAELPSYWLTLKYNKGIHSISKNEGSLQPYIRISNPGITSHLPHANYENIGNAAYYMEGLRAYWMRDIKRDGERFVMFKLIIAAPITIGLDEPLPLLPESLGRIIDVVKARILNKFPQDRIADNNPNLRATNEQRK